MSANEFNILLTEGNFPLICNHAGKEQEELISKYKSFKSSMLVFWIRSVVGLILSVLASSSIMTSLSIPITTVTSSPVLVVLAPKGLQYRYLLGC